MLKPYLKEEITNYLQVGETVHVEGRYTYDTHVIAVTKKWAYLGKNEDIGRLLTDDEKITWTKVHRGIKGTRIMQCNFTYAIYTLVPTPQE